MNPMLKQFNLPGYINGLSFADASKKIQSRFKERTDQESLATEKDMLDRLKQMQEYVKSQQESKEEPQRQEGDFVVNNEENAQNPEEGTGSESIDKYSTDQTQNTNNEYAWGGYQEEDPNRFAPEVINQRFAPTIQTNNESISSSISSLAKTGNELSDSKEEESKEGNNFGDYAAAGMTTIDLGKQVFGSTGIDTSGRVKVAKESLGNSAISGLAKGAAAGATFGPIGAGIGAAIGGISGLIGAARRKKDAAIANKNATYADAAVNDNQFAEGGNIDEKKKDVRRTTDSLVIKPISELGHTMNRVIPANNGKLNYSKSSDPEYNEARNEFVDWYANPETKKRFTKNTGYDSARLHDMTSKATSTPSYKGDAYKQPPVGAKAIFNTPDVGGKKEEIIYHEGIGSGPIQHELTHAGAMANILGPALLRTLGSPKNQKLPSDINDPNFKSASNSAKEYLSIPEEAYGNFHEFRVNMGLKPGEKINKETLRAKVKEKKLENENFYSTFEDDNIVNAINKIAYNDNSNNNQNQASMGGSINQFHKGGKPGHAHNTKAKVQAKVKPAVIPKTSGYGSDGKFIKPKIFNSPEDAEIDILKLIKNKPEEKEISGVRSGFEKYYEEKIPAFSNKENLLDNKDALRYAPALSNILQLSQLKKPEQETTPELNNRYKKNIIDEKGLTNLVKEETAGTREAILAASEGSGNSARSSLLGVQLNNTKAISDAFMKSSESNARENSQEQSFNLGVDTTNLQQRTLAQDIRARNKGAYDTEKSRLMSAIGTDIGAIGQEELYKKFPELMGSDYNFKGKYLKDKKKITNNKSKF